MEKSCGFVKKGMIILFLVLSLLLLVGCNRDPGIASICVSITPSGATVELDDEVITGTCTNINIPGVPVTKTIEVSAPGYVTYTEEHTFVSKEIYSLVKELEPMIVAEGDATIVRDGQVTQLESFSLAGTAEQTIAPAEPAAKAEPSHPDVYPLDFNSNIYGLSVDADIELTSEAGIVRIVLVDKSNNEYLVYEAYPLLTDSGSFSVNNVCEETCILDGIIPDYIRIQMTDATVAINNVHLITSPAQLSDVAKSGVASYAAQIDVQQESYKISQLNKLIEQKGMIWVAGETSVSKMSYEEKKKLFINEDGTPVSELPNLQGFEYYEGGVFELKPTLGQQAAEAAKSAQTVTSDLILPDSWDWRDVHGENWNTPVKNQGPAGTCGYFSPVAALESQINLYYNQHLDIDLSEQMVMDCLHEGPLELSITPEECSSTTCFNPGCLYCQSIYWGITDESCDPYALRLPAYDPSNCDYDHICTDWSSRVWKISDFHDYIFGSGDPNSMKQTANVSEDEFKRFLITKGSMASVVAGWRHAMMITGWKTRASDGKTIWIFKNSYGPTFSGDGYVEIVVPSLQQLGFGSLPLGPFTPPTDHFYWPAGFDNTINCVDNDGDGYCNWGISSTKPLTCSVSCKARKDCDDSNSLLGPFVSNTNYNCCEFCKDSDGGQDYYTQGSADERQCDNVGSYYEDKCLIDIKEGDTWKSTPVTTCSKFDEDGVTKRNCRLQEGFCTPENKVSNVAYNCPNGCVNGACIPDITVISPNGGEIWSKSLTYTITWDWVGDIDNVGIHLLKGNLAQVISSETPNDGSYEWTIPSTLLLGDDNEDDYIIKIMKPGDEIISDNSDGNFSITPRPTITIISPNGGESLAKGVVNTITWNSTGDVANVKIFLHEGPTFRAIAVETPNDGSYDWIIPNTWTVGNNYKIRIINSEYETISDYSDDYFSIEQGTCVPITCTELRCGTLNDGCGMYIDCGTCPSEEICVNSICCTPRTCTELGKDCGVWNTGCRTQTDCGTCSFGHICRNGVCTALPAPENVTVTVSGRVVTFLWSPVPGAESYMIEMYPNGDFTSPIGLEIVSPDYIEAVTTTGYNVTLRRGYEYYIFDIFARHAEGLSPPTRTNNVTMPIQPTITVTSPNGGESWAKGSTHTITWNSTGDIANTRIYFYEGEVFTQVITMETFNNGSYDWTIPTNWTEGSNYRIKMYVPASSGSGLVEDLSDDFFSIVS